MNTNTITQRPKVKTWPRPVPMVREEILSPKLALAIYGVMILFYRQKRLLKATCFFGYN